MHYAVVEYFWPGVLVLGLFAGWTPFFVLALCAVTVRRRVFWLVATGFALMASFGLLFTMVGGVVMANATRLQVAASATYGVHLSLDQALRLDGPDEEHSSMLQFDEVGQTVTGSVVKPQRIGRVMLDVAGTRETVWLTNTGAQHYGLYTAAGVELPRP